MSMIQRRDGTRPLECPESWSEHSESYPQCAKINESAIEVFLLMAQGVCIDSICRLGYQYIEQPRDLDRDACWDLSVVSMFCIGLHDTYKLWRYIRAERVHDQKDLEQISFIKKDLNRIVEIKNDSLENLNDGNIHKKLLQNTLNTAKLLLAQRIRQESMLNSLIVYKVLNYFF